MTNAEAKTLLIISADEFLAMRHDHDTPPHGEGNRGSGVTPVETNQEVSEIYEAERWHLLAELPLLPEDRRFIQEETRYLSLVLRNNVLGWYRHIFLKGMQAEKNPICRHNAGRRRANAFLRRYVRHLRGTVAG